MSEPISTPAIKSASSFASLLESFTGPAKITNQLWDDSLLSDDVATISYEQALRSHRRVPSADEVTIHEAANSQECAPANLPPASSDRKRKTASITIRLTREEEAQLHQRAAAAQLSVSAYLRSCIFEAESLRAQVKEALSQIRATVQVETPKPPATSSWRGHLLSHWHRSQSVKSAASILLTR